MNNDKFIEYAKQHHGEVLNTSNPEHKLALEHYLGEGFSRINNVLRLKKINPKEHGEVAEDSSGNWKHMKYDEMISGIDDVLSKSKLPHDIVTYRGVKHLPDLHNMKVGDVFSDNGYSSSSFSKIKAKHYSTPNKNPEESKSSVITIHSPKDSNAHLVHTGRWAHQEQEVLFPRNAKFQVIKHDTPGDIHVKYLQD